jgi:predicted PurR-regulated permease PerM
MEITSFILGVCAVIVIAMVVGTFLNYAGVKALKEQTNNLERIVDNEVQILNRLLGKLKDDLINYTDNLHKISEDTTNEIYRYIDSRNDKLESKFSNQMASGVEVKKALDEINRVKERLDEFIRTYQAQ